MVQGQVNYVLNPSFEQYSQCPYDVDQIKFSLFWSSIDTVAFDPLCSPEYCNNCCTNLIAGVPANSRFYQFPRTGNGMAQVVMFFDESYVNGHKRDYLQGRFYKPLTVSKSYCVTFYVNQEEVSEYSIANIGAYLDNGSIDNIDSNACALPQTTYTPQIVNTSGIITDDVNWVKIEGTFIAIGTERFITIGNFKDFSHTMYSPFNIAAGSNLSAYLIDDVSVIESNTHAYAGNDTVVTIGDSAFIGLHELGWDCSWFVQGSSTVIGTGAGIWVHPSPGANHYVIQQKLCGAITYDTVNVYASPAGVTPIGYTPHYTVYPNPVKDEVTITAPFVIESVEIMNLLGQTVFSSSYISASSMTVTIKTENLQTGIYIIKVNKEYVQKMVRA